MKAHIYKEPLLALVWNLPEGAPGYAAMERACKRFNLPFRAVKPEEAGRTVAELLGVKQAQSKAALTLDGETYPAAIVVSGLGNRIDTFVDTLNDYGAPIPLKAVATPTNRNWPFADLLAELVQEREALTRGAE